MQIRKRINKVFFTLVSLFFSLTPIRAQEDFEFGDDVNDVPIDDHLPLLFFLALLVAFLYFKKQYKLHSKQNNS
jgi:hypothetical protein